MRGNGYVNILFLCHRIPYPPNKGDKIRSFHELQFFSRGNSVFLGTTTDQPGDEDYIDEVRRYCTQVHVATRGSERYYLVRGILHQLPLSVASFYYESLQRFVDKTLMDERIDAVVCFCSSMAEYIFRTPSFRHGRLASTPLVMDFVDLDSDKWKQYAGYSHFPLNAVYYLEHLRLSRYERRILRAFRHVVFVSAREVEALGSAGVASRSIHVIPNGVDVDYFSRPDGHSVPRLPRRGPLMVFAGVMDYFANEDGVSWFCEQVLPRIRSRVPEAEFFIAGSRPTDRVWRLSEIDGVTVTGYVHDMRLYYWNADICVIPLRIARGLQNKVLEAMASGNAVVATSNASNGIVCQDNVDIVIADSEVAFAEACVALLQDEARRKELGCRALETVRRHYQWDDNLRLFSSLLRDSVGSCVPRASGERPGAGPDDRGDVVSTDSSAAEGGSIVRQERG